MQSAGPVNPYGALPDAVSLHLNNNTSQQSPPRTGHGGGVLDKRPTKCELCLKTFASHFVLERHVKSVHRGIKDLKCSQCDYVTAYKTHLKKHEKSVHQKLKDHACHICEFRTSIKGSLDRHIR